MLICSLFHIQRFFLMPKQRVRLSSSEKLQYLLSQKTTEGLICQFNIIRQFQRKKSLGRSVDKHKALYFQWLLKLDKSQISYMREVSYINFRADILSEHSCFLKNELGVHMFPANKSASSS